MALSEKQQRFADEYLKTLNATDAYKLAGYNPKSDNSAAAAASKLLRNHKVSEYLQARLKEHKLNDFMDQDEVLNKLSEIASGIPKRTEYKHYDNLKGEMTTDSWTERAPDITDQLSALQMLGKFHKMFTDKAEVELKVPTFIDDVPEGDEHADSQTTED